MRYGSVFWYGLFKIFLGTIPLLKAPPKTHFFLHKDVSHEGPSLANGILLQNCECREEKESDDTETLVTEPYEGARTPETDSSELCYSSTEPGEEPVEPIVGSFNSSLSFASSLSSLSFNSAHSLHSELGTPVFPHPRDTFVSKRLASLTHKEPPAQRTHETQQYECAHSTLSACTQSKNFSLIRLPLKLLGLIFQNVLIEDPRSMHAMSTIMQLKEGLCEALSGPFLSYYLIQSLHLSIKHVKPPYEEAGLVDSAWEAHIAWPEAMINVLQKKVPQTPFVQKFMKEILANGITLSMHGIFPLEGDVEKFTGYSFLSLPQSTNDLSVLSECWKEHEAFGPFIATVTKELMHMNCFIDLYTPHEHKERIPYAALRHLLTTIDDLTPQETLFLAHNPYAGLLRSILKGKALFCDYQNHFMNAATTSDQSPQDTNVFAKDIGMHLLHLFDDIEDCLETFSLLLSTKDLKDITQQKDTAFCFKTYLHDLLAKNSTSHTKHLNELATRMHNAHLFIQDNLNTYPCVQKAAFLVLDEFHAQAQTQRALSLCSLSQTGRHDLIHDLLKTYFTSPDTSNLTHLSALLLSDDYLKAQIAPFIRLLADLCQAPLIA